LSRVRKIPFTQTVTGQLSQ